MSLARVERRLSDLSSIEVRYFVGRSSRIEYCNILIVQYSGTYPMSGQGSDAAHFMYAMARAGVIAFEPDGVIHDLSLLSYEWGDNLEMVFDIGPEKPVELVETIFGKSPRAELSAIVVGAGCEEAVRTLLLGEHSDEPIEKTGRVFKDRESAWQFIENQLVPNSKD